MLGDGVVLFKSTPFHVDTPPQNVTVSVAGAKVMALQVSVDEPALLNFKHDVDPLWANATVLCV